MIGMNPVKLEVARVLAAAGAYFGPVSDLEALSVLLEKKRVTLETREEVAYLAAAISGAESNMAMVVNIADNLVDKFESDRLTVPFGFTWLEDLTRNLNTSAQLLLGGVSVLLLQVLAGWGLFTVQFDRVGAEVFWLYAGGVFLFAATSGVVACWTAGINKTSAKKNVLALMGYGYAALVAYSLYRFNLGSFDFSRPVFGSHWLIVWVVLAPALVPCGLFLIREWNEPHRVRQQNPQGVAQYDHLQLMQQITPGKVGLDTDVRIVPPDQYQ